ncbi:hypothetical protein P8452_05814 [Trifolium repens]|nr:hypothetical protein P8452_05814 [Trifolium repens]
MIELIQSKFRFVPELTEQTTQILKDNMNAKWKQFKHDLKSKGAPLVFQEREEISQINKRNCSKFEDLHCMGTKNLPRLIHEMTTKAGGVQPSRAEIYIDTRTRKDGSIVTKKAAATIEHVDFELVRIIEEDHEDRWKKIMKLVERSFQSQQDYRFRLCKHFRAATLHTTVFSSFVIIEESKLSFDFILCVMLQMIRSARSSKMVVNLLQPLTTLSLLNVATGTLSRRF